jgi:hypothetical protein
MGLGGAAEPGGVAAKLKARTARSVVTASRSGALPPGRLPQCMVPLRWLGLASFGHPDAPCQVERGVRRQADELWAPLGVLDDWNAPAFVDI